MKTLTEIIAYLGTKGLTFKPYHTGSYYCNERDIRVSDHYSKYTFKKEEIYGVTDAVDIVIPKFSNIEYTEQMIDELINPADTSEWFTKFVEGCKIEHTRKERVGELTFVSVDVENECVVCVNADGEVKKYFHNFINVVN
ncbi:MAG: hypothetical protein KBT36_04140 [Kurthia sp.]|nr:hypothetical protein [Candidatus Kurthia equi]